MHWERSGAYTGEVSPGMLAELCDYVIIGHSERRAHFGETVEQNEAGETVDVVTRQVKAAFAGIDAMQGTVIAYEPIWAIGTGKAAKGEQAEAISGLIRRLLSQLYGEPAAQETRIQYGGSVTAANTVEFLGQENVDGALVGGASLKAGEFIGIVEHTSKLQKSG
jgi:triosephosphate isomerase